MWQARSCESRYHSENAAMAPPTRHLRWPRLLLSMLGGIALLLVLAYVALNQAFPPERLAAMLSDQVRKTTGRDFAVRGGLSIRLLPRIGVAANDVVLGNAPWGTRKDMLVVQHARFDIALWPLLQGLVDIASVSLDGVDLLAETDRNGVGNWAMGGEIEPTSPGPAGSGSSALRLHLSSLALSQAKLSYRDGRTGSTRQVAVPKLELQAAGDGQALDATIDSGTQRWQLKGRIGRLADLALNQADWPFDLLLASDGASAAAKGVLRRGTPPRALEADVSASLSKAAALTPWVAAAARVPLPAELKGRLNVAPQSLRIDGLRLSLAQQTLSGQLKALGGNPWRIDAQLSSPSIDLARWLPPQSGAGASPQPADRRVFGNTPLALDALPDGPATLALRVDKLLVPGLPPLSQLNLQLSAQPGRLRLDPLSAAVADGTLRGSLNVSTAAGTVPRVALKLQADKLSMDSLLRATGHSAYASGGQLQLRADLGAAGNTAQALAASANGELMLSLTDTTLGSGASPLGTDLLRRLLQAVTLQPLPAASSRIDCAVLRLPLKNGVAAVNRSIALETAQLAVSAQGEVRFDDETLALAFRPSPRTALNINPVNLAQLVVLKGPWQDPKLTLDAQGVAGMAASLGLAGATGGLSLLAQQLLKAAPEKDVCRTALSGTAPSPTPPTTPAATTPSPAAQPKAPLKLPQALPEALRNLFK
jgi:AsmA family protein